jgi:hypothetical protein
MTDSHELSRMWRVADQMTTAHSILRDRYRAWSLGLTLAVLALSVLATALGFAGEPELTLIVRAKLPTWVGALACVIFFLTLVDLQLDWRSKARSHADAARQLAALKTVLRDADVRLKASEDVEVGDEYQRTMEGLIEIPDRKFLRFKARHQRKVEISKRISARPETPVWLHRVQLLLEGVGWRKRPSWLSEERPKAPVASSLPPGAEASLEAPEERPTEDQAPSDQHQERAK